MINQKKITLNSIYIAAVVVLLILLFTSFSEDSHKISISSAPDFTSGSYSNKDIIADVFQHPVFQKKQLPLLSRLLSDNYKMSADNKKIIQHFILLQKTQLSIKPLTPSRFYYHLFSNDAEDLPPLS
jgi:hypothetical protein